MTEYGDDFRGSYASINGAAATLLAMSGEEITGRILWRYLQWFATGEIPASLPNPLENDVLQKLIIDQQGRAKTAQQNQTNGRKGGRPKKTQAEALEPSALPVRPKRVQPVTETPTIPPTRPGEYDGDF